MSEPHVDPIFAKWHRDADDNYFRDAPWRQEREKVPKPAVAPPGPCGWSGPTGWMQRVAARLDERRREQAEGRSAQHEDAADPLTQARLEHRIGSMVAAGFNPGRHVFFIWGRPTVARPRPPATPGLEPSAGPSGRGLRQSRARARLRSRSCS